MMDVAHAETVERGLDAFIAQRYARRVKAEGERPEEAAWRASERCYEAARRRRRNWAAWFAYFCRQAEAHRRLSESYEARAEALCGEDRGEG